MPTILKTCEKCGLKAGSLDRKGRCWSCRPKYGLRIWRMFLRIIYGKGAY